MDKEVIKRNFSKYARYYDRYSTAQDLCALKLISKVKTNGFCKILDIGCGTGNYTRLLKMKFPQARIMAVDISEEMINVAREKFWDSSIEFVIADGETIDLDGQFDLISSNAAFQWFADLERALSRYKGHLKKGGIISFSTFGPLTFYELDRSLKDIFGNDTSINSCNFIEAAKIRRILRQRFKRFKIEEEIYKETNSSLAELLKRIKYTGTSGNGIAARSIWTPKVVKDLEKVYKKRFNNITATYQIFYCKGAR